MARGPVQQSRSAGPQAAEEDEAYGDSTVSLPSHENAADGFFQQAHTDSSG